MAGGPTVALVGCGEWGRHILRDLRSLGAEVPVVARSAESRARAEAGGAAAIAGSVEALPAIDAAVVATTTVAHAAAIEPLLERGAFTELFRGEWGVGVEPVQWNAVRTEPGVLRGVHVHPVHDDYLVVHAGRASVGLHDLRPGSPTAGLSALVEMSGAEPAALTIPHGVAHGFWFHEPSVHVYAVSHYWDTADELGCHWADPEMAIGWPQGRPRVSPRDAALPSLAVLREQLLGEAILAPTGAPGAGTLRP